MKVRRERRGLHAYDRVTGLHILVDEHPVPAEDCDAGPAVVSIALTNACDLGCSFCYAPKNRNQLSPTDVLRWCKELDGLGTLEIALGGGEPTLYGELPRVCRSIWTETELGISITTHGHLLGPALIDELEGHVSLVRLSVDAPEPLYSAMRRRPLASLEPVFHGLRRRIPFGVNTVVNRLTLGRLSETLGQAREWGAIDLLLLPETKEGKFTLGGPEWSALDEWIAEHLEVFPLRITAAASEWLSCPILFSGGGPYDYAHISAGGRLRRCSYGRGGVPVGEKVEDALRTLRGAEAGKC